MSIFSSKVRKTELTCTIDELEECGDKVLLENEMLWVVQADGSRLAKFGDGETAAINLPYVYGPEDVGLGTVVTAQGTSTTKTLSAWCRDILDNDAAAMKKDDRQASYTVIGGQLARLREALRAPNKHVNITFIGDSITWGAGATGANFVANEYTNRTLRGMRDGSDSLSYVNNFRRWIEARLNDGTNLDIMRSKSSRTDAVMPYSVSVEYGNYSDLYEGVVDPYGDPIVTANPSRGISGKNDPATNPYFGYAQVSSVGRSIAKYTLEQELSPLNAGKGRVFRRILKGDAATYEVENSVEYAGDEWTVLPAYRLNSAMEIEVSRADSGSANNNCAIRFALNGDTFHLHFASFQDSPYYSVYVGGTQVIPSVENEDGVTVPVDGSGNVNPRISGGTAEFSLKTADGTGTTLYGKFTRHTVTLPADAAGKPVEIVFYNNGVSTGNAYIILESIVLPKTVAITNNGVSGASADSYLTYNAPHTRSAEDNDKMFSNGARQGDNFVFIMLGTNDRHEQPRHADGSDKDFFMYDLLKLYARVQEAIGSGGEMIAMIAPPCVTREPTETASGDYMSMAEIERQVMKAAEQQGIDVVDNYAMLKNMDMSLFLKDQLHPNDYGHAMIAQNIEQAIIGASPVDMSLDTDLYTEKYRNGAVSGKASYSKINTDLYDTDANGDPAQTQGQFGSMGCSFHTAVGGVDVIRETRFNSSYTRSGDTTSLFLRLCNGGNSVNTYSFSPVLFSPATDNAINLGVASNRWRVIYAADGTIHTSDRKEKQDFSEIPDAVLDAWGAVEWEQFRYKSSVEKKGGYARKHSGLVAQKIYETFNAHGLDAFEYGLLCRDTWIDEDDGTEKERWGVRYEEALAMEAAYQRRRADRLEAAVEALAARVAALEVN